MTDPCSPNPCGLNADCRTSADRPVCTCLPGHQGNPLISCRRGECSCKFFYLIFFFCEFLGFYWIFFWIFLADSECPHHKVCENYHCINPCSNKCGANAHCDVRNHVAGEATDNFSDK